MNNLVERLRSDKQDCGPDIGRSCECFYQWTMDETADEIERLRGALLTVLECNTAVDVWAICREALEVNDD